ncbi:hypothetical protein ID866_10963, partial [Astraeus odoratus]
TRNRTRRSVFVVGQAPENLLYVAIIRRDDRGLITFWKVTPSFVPLVCMISPDLFEGTLRENIDPVGEHHDVDIWTSLQHSRVLVLDEATSAVDLDTDHALQEIIRGPIFKEVTILTIAHRLNTIMDYDRVLVLDEGRVVEFDTPAKLLADRTSKFYSMASEAGLTHRRDVYR